MSEERAKSVMNFLVAHGVAADRLSARGFGASQPRIDRSDPLAYTLNRRVEFHVTREHAIAHSDAATELKAPLAPQPAPPAGEVKP